jgi:haloalkane dehalogenase
LLPGATLRDLTEEEMERHREPFRESSSRVPTWRWPNEIPIEGEPPDVVEAVADYNQWLQNTEIPKLLLYANPGALVQAPLVEWCGQNMKNLSSVDIGQGVHFVQEDNPQGIGTALVEWYEKL